MTDRDALSRQYTVEPEPFWAVHHYSGAGGYDVMDVAARHGWHAVASWGQDGWDLGAWPYVIFFTRNRGDRWEVAQYVEGDVYAHAYPDQATRDTVLDGSAFWHWRQGEKSWVAQYERVEQVPPRLRGPFGSERSTTPSLIRILFIPADGQPQVWYVCSDRATLTSIVDGPLQILPLAADAYGYRDKESAQVRKVANETATALWRAVAPATIGHDALRGDVIVLGHDGAAAADCPQWPIDAMAIQLSEPPTE
jgi:hypothetical protein